MKKVLIVVFACILISFALLGVAWMQKTTILAHFLSKQMHVKVSLQSLDITRELTTLTNLWMGNPRHSTTTTSFSSSLIEIAQDPLDILNNPLIIDRIDISDISVGIEYYPDNQTNWNYILRSNSPKIRKGRDYLIRTLVLNNLSVIVTAANGKETRYPAIERMEFHDISSDSGFPIEEIEKAIFKKVMQNIFDKYLFKPFQNIPNSPVKYLPMLFQ